MRKKKPKFHHGPPQWRERGGKAMEVFLQIQHHLELTIGMGRRRYHKRFQLSMDLNNRDVRVLRYLIRAHMPDLVQLDVVYGKNQLGVRVWGVVVGTRPKLHRVRMR